MMFATRAIFVTFNVLLIVGGLWFTVACTSSGGARFSAASQDGQHPPFKEWQVIDTATGQPVSFDQWTALLLQQEIIYLGEEHHNRFHIDAAMMVLQKLKADGRTPALAMEMFGTGSICFRVRNKSSGIPRGRPVATELGRPVRGL
jgi:uncharacterized iron-regulated protein